MDGRFNVESINLESLLALFGKRGPIGGLLEQWFGVDAAAVIPGASGFARPVLIG